MATIGLDKLFYSKITEGENGDETYAAPVALAKAMTAELSVELAEATLYADDGAAEVVKEFQSGTLTLGVDDIGKSVAEDLTGAVIDENGVLISASGGRRRSGCHRLPGQESKRQIPLFLAVPRDFWYPGHQPDHQGREHRVFHPFHRGDGDPPQ